MCLCVCCVCVCVSTYRFEESALVSSNASMISISNFEILENSALVSSNYTCYYKYKARTFLVTSLLKRLHYFHTNSTFSKFENTCLLQLLTTQFYLKVVNQFKGFKCCVESVKKEDKRKTFLQVNNTTIYMKSVTR